MGNGATVEGWRTAATAERAVYLSDLHCPHHDPRAVACALSFIRWFDPAKVFLLGDICDFYQLSRFDRRPDRNLELQGDLDATREVLTRIRDAVPSAQVVYLEGNHEARLTKYLWKHPEVAGLNALRLPHLLGLDDLDISYVSADTVYRYGGLCIEHGEIVRARSGYSARGQLDRRGVSGVSGHTHRLSVHYHTDLAGVHWWAENGCLCGLTPEYLKAPDWQQGFTVTHTDPSGRIAVEQVLVSDGSAVFAGRVFGG